MSDSDIRKLRKKLRQIENLERLERDLTDEELLKVSKKIGIRESLLQLLVSRCENSFDSSGFADDRKQTLSSIPPETVENDEPYQSQSTSEETVCHNYTSDLIIKEEATSNEPAISLDKQITSSAQEIPQTLSEDQLEKAVRKPTTDAGLPEISRPQFTNERPKKGKKTEHKKEKLKTLYRSWWDSHFHISTLEGHNDLVTCIDVCGSILVTGSRDTTVKVWNLESLSEKHNLGGHTGTVTGVCLISPEESLKYAEAIGLDKHDCLVISCSLDCTFKLWSVNTGHELRSTYTYNPVTCLVFCPYNQCVVTGSDGGKIEIWKLETSENIRSIIAYSESVTSLQVCDRHIYSASSEGIIKVLEIRDEDLACLFESESLHTANGTPITQRYVRSMTVNKDVIYFGDDGINIKALVWRKGLVHKLSNHQEEFGVTDALCCHDNLLISSAYNLDNGLAYLNIRCSLTEDYITTLNDNNTGRMVRIACVKHPNEQVSIITAGIELKVWNMVSPGQSVEAENDVVVTGQCFARLGRAAQDSDDESEIETTDSEDDSEENLGRLGSQLQTASWWTGWCNIV